MLRGRVRIVGDRPLDIGARGDPFGDDVFLMRIVVATAAADEQRMDWLSGSSARAVPIDVKNEKPTDTAAATNIGKYLERLILESPITRGGLAGVGQLAAHGRANRPASLLRDAKRYIALKVVRRQARAVFASGTMLTALREHASLTGVHAHAEPWAWHPLPPRIFRFQPVFDNDSAPSIRAMLRWRPRIARQSYSPGPTLLPVTATRNG